MMGWTAYRLVYQAKSPIHIGWHTLGFIKLTRFYISGKNMWGAMTANLARAEEGKYPTVYVKYGGLLRTSVLISYFYPAINSDKPLLPEFAADGLKYGDYKASEFERLFIKSYGQTAVLPESNTAEDESLHESEFISPVVYDGETKKECAVFFVGYIFISEKAGYNWKGIKDAVTELFVGGDRKYGWGRLLLDMGKTIKVADSKAFENDLDLSGTELKIKIREGKPIPAHLSINSAINVKGDIEPLVGREWGEIIDSEGKQIVGAGQRISEVTICWMPGSVLQREKTLQLGYYGILKKEDHDV